MSISSSLAETPFLPLNSSFLSINCLTFSTSKVIFTAFSLGHILLILPLITIILYLGYQRCRQQSSVSSALAAASHSDVFTYHMVAIEMIAVFGCLLYCVGVNANCPETFSFGFYIFSSTWCAKTFFHMLTCMERYLAVVHPVTYLSLKNSGGIRVRNGSIAFAWLLCFVWGVLMREVHVAVRMIIFFLHVVLIMISICFCCICVLRALRSPGPGKTGGSKERVDPMKQRAFNTVLIIMGVLWLCLGGMLVCYAIVDSRVISETQKCIVWGSVSCFSIPSSLVLPLLYLHRAGKLPRCRCPEK